LTTSKEVTKFKASFRTISQLAL